jgi:hypothetical protein
MTGAPYNRTRTEIVRDVLAACRRLGELGLAAELAMRTPDITALETTAAGLQRMLVEYRAAGGHGDAD